MMDIKDSFKLEKLKITVKKTPENTGGEDGEALFEVMFNPESFTRHYGNKIQSTQGLGSTNGSTEARPVGSEPEKLELQLVVDGTGAADFGLPVGLGGATPSVEAQINTFLDVCYQHQGRQHSPNVINIKWGILDFDCRLEKADINYTSFDRNGQPLRAEISTIFTQHNPAEEQETPVASTQGEDRSPDLTHTRIVKAGDTLPLLTQAIYGSAKYYLQVAAANQLNNFRQLVPGQQLIFPPLEK